VVTSSARVGEIISVVDVRLFLVVEWESEATHELVSLALVSQDGRHRFYAERDPLPATPSAFVCEVVYPLLDRGSVALPDPAITRQLRAFLAQWQRPLVLADSELDFTLLAHALSGFGMPDLPPAPSYRPMLVTFGDVLTRVEDYFELHPQAKARRHHALVDAEALRWAFEGAIGGREHDA
jgi:hypothetical protein